MIKRNYFNTINKVISPRNEHINNITDENGNFSSHTYILQVKSMVLIPFLTLYFNIE